MKTKPVSRGYLLVRIVTEAIGQVCVVALIHLISTDKACLVSTYNKIMRGENHITPQQIAFKLQH